VTDSHATTGGCAHAGVLSTTNYQERVSGVEICGRLSPYGSRRPPDSAQGGAYFGLLYGLELQAARRARDDAARLTTYTFEDRG